MKKVIGLVIGILLLSVQPAVAVNYKSTPTPSATPAAQVNSFEMFWPIVAGRVAGDSFYQLKILKEKIRGFFIFGNVQRADYSLFLATKRLIEGEKLIDLTKDDLAGKTLREAERQLENTQASLAKALSGNEPFGETSSVMVARLKNIEKFVNFLAAKNESQKEVLTKILERINSLLSKF